MDKSVSGVTDAEHAGTRPMATYLPSLGSRAPMFIKSSSPVSETMYNLDDTTPEPANPPATPWEDTDDERDFNPIRSPVNMLLATDLSEVGARGSMDTVSQKVGTRWPYLKQQAARHVYGNLRSRLQSREKLPPSAVSLTYAPNYTELQPLNGMQIQAFGIKTKHQLSNYKSRNDDVTKLRPLLPKELKPFDETIDYRISLKSAEVESRGCFSAPPPTAESAFKPNTSDGANSLKPTLNHQRSKTAREFYRPKRGPLVKFDSIELPKKLQREPLPQTSVTSVISRVTWSDVVTAKSNGVYRDSPNGISRGTSAKDPQKLQLYLSSELWGILDEDIGAVNTVAAKS